MKNTYINEKINFKTVIALIAVCVLVSVLIPIGKTQAFGTCPFSSQENRTIISFVEKRLRADQGEAKAMTEPKTMHSIPAGIYNIKLASYDNHSEHVNPDQTNESWFAILKDSNNNVIKQTPAIRDIPDNKDLITQTVATNFSIPKKVSNIIAYHNDYPSNNPNSVQAICIAFDKVVSDPKLVISKSINKTSADPGDQIIYTLNYKNTGNGKATNVVIRDPFINLNQSYLTFISSSPTGFSTWNIGTLNPGESGKITIKAKIKNSVPYGTTKIKDRFTINSSETSLKYSNYVSVWVTRNQEDPNLVISKSIDRTSADPGDEIVYTLNYQNTGNGSANNVIVRDPFINLNQSYLTFISSNPSPLSGNDTWNIGILSPGQSGSITIRARINDSVPYGTIEIKDRFSIYSNETSLIYSNYVSVWISQEPNNPSISINKLVRNVYLETSFSDLVDAEKNDEVEFSLEIRSTGDATINNVKVWDSLPSYLEYISGTTRVDGIYKLDGVIGSGIYIGDINSGNSKVVKFRARVEDWAYSTIVTNYGYADSDNTGSVNDTARVRIEDEENNPELRIEKLGRNVTRNNTYFTKTVYARPGDEIEFLIRLNSTGDTTVENVRTRDDLPGKLRYINGSTTVNGSYKSDGIITGSGIYIGDIYLGNVKEIKFKVEVYDENSFYSDLTTLTNNAYAWATDVNNIKDYAFVKVEKDENEILELSINKSVRNISRGESNWVNSTVASPSQEVEFLIEITNIGDTNLTNVRVWDALPVNLSYVSGTTFLNNSSTASIINNDLNIGTLNKGQTKEIRFKALVAASSSFSIGTTTLFNTGYTKADNVSQISDQASVVVPRGEVKGATTIITGASSFGFMLLAIISAFLAFFVYCSTREAKLLEILSNEKGNKLFKGLIKFYFRIKFFATVTKLRFKKVYW